MLFPEYAALLPGYKLQPRHTRRRNHLRPLRRFIAQKLLILLARITRRIAAVGLQPFHQLRSFFSIFLRQAFGAGMTALIACREHIKCEVAAEYQRDYQPAPMGRKPLPNIHCDRDRVLRLSVCICDFLWCNEFDLKESPPVRCSIPSRRAPAPLSETSPPCLRSTSPCVWFRPDTPVTKSGLPCF